MTTTNTVRTPVSAIDHCCHERDFHGLNLNEFRYRHPKGTFQLSTVKGSVTLKDGVLSMPEWKLSLVKEAFLITEGDAPTTFECKCRKLDVLGAKWRAKQEAAKRATL